LVAVGWVAILAFFFLFRYDGWRFPLKMAYLFGETFPTLAIGPYFGEFWRARLTDAGCVTTILATAFAVGAVAINRLTPEKNLLTALLSLATGLWILSVSILLVGAATISGLPWVFLLAGCWLLPAPRRFFRRVGSGSEKLDGWARLMLACVIAAALLNLLSAMTPPFEYDELEYHLGAPAEYIKAGRIIALPHNFYSNLPQLTETLYLLALKMSSGVAAKLLHWSFGLFGAVAVYAISARLWQKQIGLTAAALFYCVPLMQDLSETARIDLATMFFAMLAFGALLYWQQDSRDNRYLWLSAITAGCAVATKWTAVPVVLLPAVVFVAVMTRSFRLSFVFCLLSSIFVVPWLIKNWLFLGNPVYPLLSNVFHSPYWNAAQAALLGRYESLGFDNWTQSVSLVWQYSFKEPFTVPLLLMTAPLILLLRNVESSARRAGWLFVLAYIGWFLLTFRPWRFLCPTFPLAAMIGAYALHIVAQERFVRMIVRVSVTVMVMVGLTEAASVTLVDERDYMRLPPQMSFVQYELGQVSREEFVERMGGGMFEPIVWMNRHLPAAAKVLYVGDARMYYARNPVVWSTAFDQHVLSEVSRRATTTAQWHDLLHQQGIAYIYINSEELARLGKNYGYLRDVNWKMFYEMLQEDAELIHETYRGAVFRLKD
jgi:4-amino-4-deoxy-L-arabinose transferase-like glycosyltransferase